MGLSTYATENAILARLKTIPHVDIYDDEVPYEDPGVVPKKDANGTILPYVNVYFGGPREAADDKGLCGPQYNGTVAYLTVQVNGGTSEMVRRVKDLVTNKLVGWVPDSNSGYLKLEGSVSYRKASTTTIPKMYVYEIAFSYRSNMSN